MRNKFTKSTISRIMKSCVKRSSYFLFLVGLFSAVGMLAFFYTSPTIGSNMRRRSFGLQETTNSSKMSEDSKSQNLSSSFAAAQIIKPSNSTSKPSPNPEKCKPKQKIGFLKTHKTASSSVQNIFLRFGLMNRLDFVLPSRGNHLSNPKHFYMNLEPFLVDFLDQESSKLPWHETLKESQGYNIFALHTCWNQQEVSSLLGPEAVYVTILRNPEHLFESLYSYVNFQSKLKLTLSQYIKSLNVSSTLYQHRLSGYLGLNQQLYDLGQNISDLYDRAETEQMIKTIELTFNLVMIAERFDESMVLLADVLCWPLEKVVSLKVNARKPQLKQEITKEESVLLSQWQEGDEMLYRHFLRKFDEKVEAFGSDRMNQSLHNLRQLNSAIEKRCVMGTTDKQHLKKESDLAPWSPDVIAYNVPESDYQCMLMAMNENSLVDKVRKSQLIRWRAKQNQFNKTTTTSKPMKQKTKLFQKQLNKATIT